MYLTVSNYCFLSCSADCGGLEFNIFLFPNVLEAFLYCYLLTHVTDEKLFIKNESLSFGSNDMVTLQNV